MAGVLPAPVHKSALVAAIRKKYPDLVHRLPPPLHRRTVRARRGRGGQGRLPTSSKRPSALRCAGTARARCSPLLPTWKASWVSTCQPEQGNDPHHRLRAQADHALLRPLHRPVLPGHRLRRGGPRHARRGHFFFAGRGHEAGVHSPAALHAEVFGRHAQDRALPRRDAGIADHLEHRVSGRDPGLQARRRARGARHARGARNHVRKRRRFRPDQGLPCGPADALRRFQRRLPPASFGQIRQVASGLAARIGCTRAAFGLGMVATPSSSAPTESPLASLKDVDIPAERSARPWPRA